MSDDGLLPHRKQLLYRVDSFLLLFGAGLEVFKDDTVDLVESSPPDLLDFVGEIIA